MNNAAPSIEDWKDLYNITDTFKKLECWKWMTDSDLFGVRNPETGDISYCCIMGINKEFYGLAAYSGTKGLDTYLKIRSGDLLPGTDDLIFLQDCLILSFENREYVQNEDMSIIKGLSLKFRGRNQWPVFRGYRPGYHPWFLTKDEVVFFSKVLAQAIDVATRFKKNRNLLSPPNDGVYLVRVPCKEEGSLTWKDTWCKPAAPVEDGFDPEPINEIHVRRIKKARYRQHGVLELDFFFTPAPVQEKKGQRPYYPYALALVDHDSGLVLDMALAPQGEWQNTLQTKLLEYIDTGKAVPLRILARKKEIVAFLQPILSMLDVKVSLVKSLENIDGFRKALRQQFGG
ncbi:MAG: hypothetical protein GXY80_08520 [Syntrophorhabdus aromaticivorans]|uniref:NurA domain-containing protein n=1 Tax=Syntrophorhabdus aromaticivorans TaxID=328301 RepID=A0A351U6C6_9BACT|nr:hypothetical protein [Syntrophorhabdus aromaticivorans]HBA55507.1 hypothetical protein [Syntrophorhabdus aromaticivorans]